MQETYGHCVTMLTNQADKFSFKSFYNQIAVAYGLGLRLNFDYFILRFDGGMKAINPAYTSTEEHYALWHPNLKRDFTFHFRRRTSILVIS